MNGCQNYLQEHRQLYLQLSLKYIARVEYPVVHLFFRPAAIAHQRVLMSADHDYTYKVR